mmetsp:Transcript_1975/g.6227  ORF Transcript_1975/g.6227 Transcript_1975/m.6227 type:complete len:213 (+) Transcript_1975:188-826(+)
MPSRCRIRSRCTTLQPLRRSRRRPGRLPPPLWTAPTLVRRLTGAQVWPPPTTVVGEATAPTATTFRMRTTSSTIMDTRTIMYTRTIMDPRTIMDTRTLPWELARALTTGIATAARAQSWRATRRTFATSNATRSISTSSRSICRRRLAMRSSKRRPPQAGRRRQPAPIHETCSRWPPVRVIWPHSVVWWRHPPCWLRRGPPMTPLCPAAPRP